MHGSSSTTFNESGNALTTEEPECDDETKSILKIMKLHAEHRGPREIALQGDNLTRRYFRRRADHHGPYLRPQVRPAVITVGDNSVCPPPPPQVVVPKEYVCHMCGNKGHHIRQCPLRLDSGGRQTKKIKAAPGIPRNWLTYIDTNDIAHYDSVYCLPSGQLAVLKQEHVVNVDALNLASAALRCPLCSRPFRDPTIVACCGTTYCRDCILPRIGEKCPNGCARVLGAEDLSANTAIAAVQGPAAAAAATGPPPPPPPPDTKTAPAILPLKPEIRALANRNPLLDRKVLKVEDKQQPIKKQPIVLSNYESPFATLVIKPHD